MKICKNCNKEYKQKTKSGNDLYCSSECAYSYRKFNTEFIEKRKNYYLKNKDKIIKRNNEQRIKDPEKRKIWENNRHSLRAKVDINYKLRKNLRNRLYQAIKNNYKTGSAVKDLGCSIEEFKRYIESLWQPGMTWDNYGPDGWHIDHKNAISKFDLTNEEQLKKACNYTNLQPMWAKDNLSKGNK